MVNRTYKVEEVFEDDPDNADNVLMNIPPAIAEEMGWKPGDTIKITQTEEGTISLMKVENE